MHLDSGSEWRHPEPVEGASASALRQAQGALFGQEDNLSGQLRSNAVAPPANGSRRQDLSSPSEFDILCRWRYTWPMMGYLWLAVGLGLLTFLGYRAGRAWLDAGRRGYTPVQRLGQSLAGAVLPDRYWWGARIETMSGEERDDLLVHETAALGLARADSQPCPLCGAEVPRAWTLDAVGDATTGPRPIECPGCDFRLDSCRFCAHFSPGPAGGSSPWLKGDTGSGRCERYKTSQLVEDLCTPDMARRLRARGYEQIRGPMPIVDSYLPPDSCRAFAPDRKRMRESKVRWPRARRTALLRLLLAADFAEGASSPEHTGQVSS